MQQDKNRKSEAQKLFEEADNAGRFAGNDMDAQAARQKATDNIKQQGGNNRSGEDRNDEDQTGLDVTNDNSGEAQNVNTGRGREGDLAGNNRDMDHARNKASQGIKEGRDTGSSDNTDRKGGSH